MSTTPSPGSLHEKLLERKRVEGSRPKLTDAQVVTIRTWFDQHPDQRHCYLFYDGSLEGEDCGFKCKPSEEEYSPHQSEPARPTPVLAVATGMTPYRMEQINQIATRGIPALVGRGHSQIELSLGVPYGTKQSPPPTDL